MSDVVTEMRELAAFDRIALGGVGHLVVRPGDRESVEVQASPALIPDVVTEVKGHTLHLRTRRRGFWPQGRLDGPITFTVTFRELAALDLSGAGTVAGSGLCADHLALAISGAGKMALQLNVGQLIARISGSGRLSLAGEAERQDLTISGAGELSARELVGRQGRVAISGSGCCAINVADELDVSVSGCGNVEYLGNPRLKKRVSGVGRVRGSRAEDASPDRKES